MPQNSRKAAPTGTGLSIGLKPDANTVKGILRAVRQNCKGCSGGPEASGWMDRITNCEQGRTCPLWPYRFGMTPRVALKQGRDVIPGGE